MADSERPTAVAAWEFEQFIGRLLSKMNGRVAGGDDSPAGPSIGVDYVLDGQDVLLVESKLQAPQTDRRAREIFQRMQAAIAPAQALVPGKPVRLVLAFPQVASKDLSRHGFEVWDGPRLQELARNHGLPVPRAVKLSPPPGALTGPTGEVQTAGHALLDRLSAVKPGRPDWPLYEKFCEDALNFLFCPPLATVHTQSRDRPGHNRRDFILPNRASEGYWAFMRENYHAHLIIADAKNSGNKVGKNDVLQLANYLRLHGAGLFGLILSRLGASDAAKWTIREHWVLHDKLIVVLNDEELRKMLRSRIADEDPSELIRQKIEDFRLEI